MSEKESKEITKEISEFLRETTPDKQPSVTAKVWTAYQIAKKLKIELFELRDFLSSTFPNLSVAEQTRVNLLTFLQESFYQYSFKNKITKGIDMFLDKEFVAPEKVEELKVIVDTTQYRVNVPAFTMGHEKEGFVKIKNERDEIVVIPDPKPQNEEPNLEDLGLEVLDESEAS